MRQYQILSSKSFQAVDAKNLYRNNSFSRRRHGGEGQISNLIAVPATAKRLIAVPATAKRLIAVPATDHRLSVCYFLRVA